MLSGVLRGGDGATSELLTSLGLSPAARGRAPSKDSTGVAAARGGVPGAGGGSWGFIRCTTKMKDLYAGRFQTSQSRLKAEGLTPSAGERSARRLEGRKMGKIENIDAMARNGKRPRQLYE